MRFTRQLVIHADDAHETTVEDGMVLEQPPERIAHLGLSLAEAKQLLAQRQSHLLAQQVAACLATHSRGDTCGTPLRTKGQHTRTFRTLFGTVTLPSPRVDHCPCQQSPATTVRPLTTLLTEPTTPELPVMETTWASLVSSGLTVQALKDVLPVAATLEIHTVQNHTLAVTQRCEDALGAVPWAFVEGCPADWETLPIPDGPITLGVDGGSG
jgi:hypothetical protein